MTTTERFFDHLHNNLQAVLDNEQEHIREAARLVAETFKKGGKFYAFGSGHSHMIAEELYIRAGGLAWVHAIQIGRAHV